MANRSTGKAPKWEVFDKFSIFLVKTVIKRQKSFCWDSKKSYFESTVGDVFLFYTLTLLISWPYDFDQTWHVMGGSAVPNLWGFMRLPREAGNLTSKIDFLIFFDEFWTLLIFLTFLTLRVLTRTRNYVLFQSSRSGNKRISSNCSCLLYCDYIGHLCWSLLLVVNYGLSWLSWVVLAQLIFWSGVG